VASGRGPRLSRPGGGRVRLPWLADQQGDDIAETPSAVQVAGTSPHSARASLLAFSLDGSAVSAHRLVMRVIWENLTAQASGR
jgi:hypothetical protein